MKKKCGGCQHFQKLKNDMISSGICHLRDGRCNTDSPACELWKAMPYTRNKVIVEPKD